MDVLPRKRRLPVNAGKKASSLKNSAIKLCNDTPVDIGEAATLKCFKKKLKAFLVVDHK